MPEFRPSLNEDDRQLLIDILEFALGRVENSRSDLAHNATRDLMYKICRRKIRQLQEKLFPALYPKKENAQ